MTDTGLQNKVVIVTGAARGIGAATASLMADRGARVVLADIDGDLARAGAESIGRGAVGFGLDVSDREAFERLIDTVESDVGPVDVLVNNAGIAVTSPRVGEQDPAMIDRTIAVNLTGVINGTVAVVKRMEKRRTGHVVNVASLAGVMGISGLSAYSASKFGAVGFTEAIRIEYAGSGLRFTCVMPGPVETDQMVGTSGSPVVKLVKPEAIAAAIVTAVIRGKDRVYLPRSSGVLVRITSLLPPALAVRLNRLTGMDRVYTDVDYSARAEYVNRVSAESE
ncbi:MAG TPA: SDR family NAD(P)-dependent oxidoreductase [Solirubrobacterales bacterium]|nr:SDR family NAD(P)-dependent oxidoreductase [Solirubrobacterales bacterium]